MTRATVLLFLLGCGGSGATVSDSASSDLSEGRPRPVEPTKPLDPVAPVDPTVKFECKTTEALSDGVVRTIRFALHGETLEPAVEIEPPHSALAPLSKASLERSGGKLTLSEERTELTLFENSDLERGYVKAEGEYSTVSCTKGR